MVSAGFLMNWKWLMHFCLFSLNLIINVMNQLGTKLKLNHIAVVVSVFVSDNIIVLFNGSHQFNEWFQNRLGKCSGINMSIYLPSQLMRIFQIAQWSFTLIFVIWFIFASHLLFFYKTTLWRGALRRQQSLININGFRQPNLTFLAFSKLWFRENRLIHLYRVRSFRSLHRKKKNK